MAGDAIPHSAKRISPKSQSELMQNDNTCTSMLPRTASLLAFNRYLMLAYSPSSQNIPPLISPPSIPTPSVMLSWLRGLRTINVEIIEDSLNLSTQERQYEKPEARFNELTCFKGSSRQPITSTPISSQSNCMRRPIRSHISATNAVGDFHERG
ncbi:hypothetical protein Aperf_G00000013659 [Anoplocephala perfoliata]